MFGCFGIHGERVPGRRPHLAGFSFGSRTGLAVGMHDDRIKRLISIGTPVDKYDDYDFLIGVRKPVLFVHGDRDEFGSVANLKKLVDEVSKTAETELVILKTADIFLTSIWTGCGKQLPCGRKKELDSDKVKTEN